MKNKENIYDMVSGYKKITLKYIVNKHLIHIYKSLYCNTSFIKKAFTFCISAFTINESLKLLQGAPKLYFMHYSCVAMIMFIRIHISLHFLPIL